MSQYGKPYEPLDVSGPSRTIQSGKDQCDINLIMATFTKTGMLTHVASGLPVFADVSEVPDYAAAIANVRAVEEYFAGLPPAVRARFENSGVEFMAYLEAGNDEDDLRKLGLEILGDPRKRSSRTRESDVVVDPPTPPSPIVVEPPEAPGTVST